MLQNKAKKKTMRYLGIITMMIIVYFLLLSDFVGVQIKGIAYFMDNKKYSHEISQDSNFYSVQIDLDNLDGNIGKVLYDQNGVKIEIEKVYKTKISGEDYDGYVVNFRSTPKYSTTNGTFISFFGSGYSNQGVTYLGANQAKCTVQYNGISSDSILISAENADQLVGWAPFNLRAIQDGALENAHTITFTVSNLYLHYWTRK